MNETKKQLILDLLERYKENFLETPLSKDGAYELYKWELITKCHEKTDVEIIRNFKPINVVHVQTVYPVLTELLKSNQQQLIDCFNGLKDENRSLSERLSIFKKEMGDLCGDKFKSKADDERTASAFLACWNPQKYTFYKDELYKNYCDYIGEQSRAVGEKYPHYLQLLADLAEIIKQDPELVEKFQNETEGLIQCDLLTAQNVLWQMKDTMVTDKAVVNDSFSFKDFSNVIKSLLNNNEAFSINKRKKDFIWVNAKCFAATDEYHYEFCADYTREAGHDRKHVFVEIHFEGPNHSAFENALTNIRGLYSFKWSNLGFRINNNGFEMRGNVNDVADKALRELYDLDLLVGKTITQIISKLKMNTEIKNILQIKKNIILQGAPGTGKTYNTAALALSICGETIPEKHEDVMKRYGELQEEGRIGFCTFHQSMDYEDFVEGIKPKTVNEQVSYEIEPGIFKTMCENAKSIITEKKSEKIDFSKTRVFKMSLGEKGKDDAEIFDYCLENNVVGLGWGRDKDFSQCKTREDFKTLDDTWGAFAMEVFKQWMQIGDVILISDGTKSVKAIARIVGDYEFHKDAPIDMCQFRKVEWLYSGDLIPISKLYDKNLSQQSIYAFYFTSRYGKPDYNGTIKVDVINDIITGKVDDETPQNYVLIIDEINRGNVSKIFGELITLIEADKRIGGDHPIKVILPYSKESFGVPSNLYIIGTMNTTDRSVGNIDYAVRRRFAFVTLKADKELVKQNSIPTAVELFESVESFLKKYRIDMDFDDLMVGHSYFFAKDENELTLKWQYEILPLLNEYIKDNIVNAKTISSDTSIADFVNTYKPESQSDTIENNE